MQDMKFEMPGNSRSDITIERWKARLKLQMVELPASVKLSLDERG